MSGLLTDKPISALHSAVATNGKAKASALQDGETNYGCFACSDSGMNCLGQLNDIPLHRNVPADFVQARGPLRALQKSRFTHCVGGIRGAHALWPGVRLPEMPALLWQIRAQSTRPLARRSGHHLLAHSRRGLTIRAPGIRTWMPFRRICARWSRALPHIHQAEAVHTVPRAQDGAASRILNPTLNCSASIRE